MSENFAAYPVSLSEHRAETSRKASDWSPRDALIALLRDIDSGDVKVDAMVICYRSPNDDGAQTRFSMATPDALTGLGLLSRVAAQINAA